MSQSLINAILGPNACQKENPVICWYPSSGYDVKICEFIQRFAIEEQDEAIDYFIFTDTIFNDFNQNNFYNEHYHNHNVNVYAGIEIQLGEPENLAPLNAPIIPNFQRPNEIDPIPVPVRQSPMAYRMTITLQKNNNVSVIEALILGAQNETFAINYLLRYHANIKYFINKLAFNNHGGRSASGIWRVNLFEPLNTAFFISTLREGENQWNETDDEVIRIYPELGPRPTPDDGVFISYDIEQPNHPIRPQGSLKVWIGENYYLFPTVVTRNLHNDDDRYNQITHSRHIGINQVNLINH
jgi:hypothetical protein